VASRWPGLRGRALHLLPGVSRRSFFRRVDPADVVFLGYRAGPRVERKWGIRVPALPLGVDDAFFATPLRNDPGSSTLLFVGRLDASKHPDWLADWFAASGLATRGFALEIVGDGPLGAALAARHRGTPGIRLLGRLGEAAVIERLSAARLLVHPSDLESFGLVVLEAMAAGVPVITHDLPGIRAWAGDHPTYAPHLDGAAWLDAVRRFDDERRWAETAEDNRAFARGFGWDAIATQVLDRLQEPSLQCTDSIVGGDVCLFVHRRVLFGSEAYHIADALPLFVQIGSGAVGRNPVHNVRRAIRPQGGQHNPAGLRWLARSEIEIRKGRST